MKTIRKIEPTIIEKPTRKKVAGYARVSAETDRTMHSLSAQVSYYSDLIQKHPEWEYAGVYADEGISGTSENKRDAFKELLVDAEAGKIDIILTKSISRFARNTVDLLETVRHLRELGIEVRFEKEHINSLSEDGELMLTLLASFAQEESRSISENIRWSIKKKFEQGILNGKFRILGYRWEDDHLLIVPEEATIVRRIFQNFLDGKSRLETEREFAAEGITTINGCRFVDSNIKVILTNITYTGNLLLQKEYLQDHITKKRKKNHGELPQYFVAETHEPIIDMETFRYVQEEIARRKELGAFANKSLNITCFTSKIKCGNCGCSFMHNTRKNRAKDAPLGYEKYTTWGCGTKKKKGGRCPMKEIPERQLKRESAKVLELEEFDDDVFLQRVEKIVIPENFVMEFHFTDGTTLQHHWVNTSKKDCWTPERRAAKGKLVKERQLTANSSCYTSRIVCESCHANYRRSTRKRCTGEKYGLWICPTSHTCDNPSIHEDTLNELTCKVLGIDHIDDAVFAQQIDHIEIAHEGRLRYFFRDGHTVEEAFSTKRRMPPFTEERKAAAHERMIKTWRERNEKDR